MIYPHRKHTLTGYKMVIRNNFVFIDNIKQLIIRTRLTKFVPINMSYKVLLPVSVLGFQQHKRQGPEI